MSSQSNFRFDDKMNYDFIPPPRPPTALDANLTAITAANLVRRLDEADLAYLFKHALVQDTTYSTLMKHERRRLHHLVAESLERAYPGDTNSLAAALAAHYWESEAWEPAAAYSMRAGANALRVYALREALAHYERALAALDHQPAPPPLILCDALLGWADAALKLRPYAEQLQKLERAEQIARALDDKHRLSRALYGIGSVHLASGHGVRSIIPFAECFTIADELADERLTILPTLSMGMATLDANPRAALTYFERAIELAQIYDTPDPQATAWGAKGMAHARLGEFSAAHAAIAQAQTLLANIKSPMTTSDIYLFAGWTFFDLGDLEQGLKFGQNSVDTARASNNMECICYAYNCVGFNHLARQQLSEATAAFEQAIERSRYSGADIFENLGQAGLAMTRFFSGQTEALADLESAYQGAQALNNQMGAALMAQSLGIMYSLIGAPNRAETMFNAALAYFRPNEMAPYLVRTLEPLAQLYDQTGRPTEAEVARAEAAHWQQFLSPAS